MKYKEKYPNLFKEGKVGKQIIKNRVVVTPVGLTYADSNGEVGDRLFSYLEERAKGGAGIVMPGIVLVDSKTGKINPNELCLENQAQCMSFAHLARMVHKYDAKIYLQLYHPGKCTVSNNLGGIKAWSASEVPTANSELTKEMTHADIAYIVNRFANAAQLAKKAGVDGVEIHAAHGYLLNQFLSPLYNKRKDEYGGSLENRARIIIEIYDAIRKVTGDNFTVGIRISADEFINGGNTLEDGVAFSKIWDSVGMDYINVNCGLQETSHFNREPWNYDQGWKKHLAKAVKMAVSCPVIAVNTIKKPDFAEKLLKDNVCDFVGLSRGHLADPHWTKKIMDGKEDEIRTCISCLNCMDTFIQGVPPTCTVNAALGREREFSNMNKNGAGKSVVVIGGGPGGMEAARILAERKFHVVLFDDKKELGGQLNYAEKPPHKNKISWLKEGMKEQVKSAGVDVKLGEKADIDAIKEIDPVGVFLCTGATPVKPKSIKGIDNDNVYTIPQIMENTVDLDGKNVIVVGGGLTGLETAMFLSDKGCKVKIIEQADKVGVGVFGQCLNEVVMGLEQRNVEITTGTKLVSIEDDIIVVENNDGEEVKMQAEAVVLSLGSVADNSEIKKYKETFNAVRVIGDANGNGRIIDAISDAFNKAWVFEPEMG